jgi:CRP/FNR family transcriptional regulator, anaerobic regulatory protein
MPRAFFPALFAGAALDPHELRKFQKLATPVNFRSGETIFSHGEVADAVFGLSRGLVRLYRQLPDGRRQVLAFALPGHFLGIPLVERYTLSADAIGEVVLSRFSRADLAAFIEASPNAMRLMIRSAARELDIARDQLLILGKGSAEQKVAIFLASWRNRLARTRGLSATIPLPMRRQDIADFLGLTLETVCRELGKLAARNAIRILPKGVRLIALEPRLCESLGDLKLDNVPLR